MSVAREVSVVIPAYRHEAYVEAALESVRAQTLVPGEVVVVNDGSPDGTLAVVERVREAWRSAVRGRGAGGGHAPELRILHQENRGAHAALNRAIETARGPWIAILNSDDVLRPARLEQALGLARASGAALVVGRVELIDGEGHPLAPDHPTAEWYRRALGIWEGAVAEGTARSGGAAAMPGSAPGVGPLVEAAKAENAAATTSNFFLLKDLWRRLGGFRAYRWVHDYDFLLRALALAPDRVAFAPELVTGGYRVHASNTITENVEAAMAERAAMLRARARFRRLHAVVGRVSRRAVERAIERGRTPVRASPGSATAPAAETAHPAPLRCGIVVRDLDAGGLEEVVATLALEFPAHGIEPVIFCTHGGGRTADTLARAGVRVEIGRGRPREWRRWLDRARPRVLSTHFVPLDFHQEAARAGVPAVDVIQNLYAWFGERDWEAERTKAGLVRARVAASPMVAEYYTRNVGARRVGAGHVALGPTTVIPNRVRGSTTCQVPRSWARRFLEIPPDAFVFVHAGRLDRQKNPVALLAAFREVRRRHPRARLLLAAGREDPEVGAELREAHGDLLASGDARIVRLPHGVAPLLSAADAYVSSAFFEGWSLAVTEALLCGLPVVLSDTGGSRELAGEDGERGWVVPNPAGDPLGVSPAVLDAPDPAALARYVEEAADRMASLVEAPFTADRRAAIRAWARDELDAARSVEAHAEALRRALE